MSKSFMLESINCMDNGSTTVCPIVAVDILGSVRPDYGACERRKSRRNIASEHNREVHINVRRPMAVVRVNSMSVS
jgi:hypothetical protein